MAVSLVVVVLNALTTCLLVLYVVRTYWHRLLASVGLEHVEPNTRAEWTFSQMRHQVLKNVSRQKLPFRSWSSARRAAGAAGAAGRASFPRQDSLEESRTSLQSSRASVVVESVTTGVASGKAAVIWFGTVVAKRLRLKRSRNAAKATA